MTANARVVFDDCKVVLNSFTEGIQGAAWRIKWVSAVALLRAVGHVLGNVDNNKKINPKLSMVIEEKWKLLNRSKPKPIIFWQFIEKERNNVIKEYKLGAGQNVAIDLESKKATYSYTMTSVHSKVRTREK